MTLTTMHSFIIKNRAQQLILLLALLIFADGLISKFLTANGLGQEANPLLQTIITGDRFLLLKAAGAALVALLMWDIQKRQPRVALVSMAVFVALYTGILYWNLTAFLVSSF